MKTKYTSLLITREIQVNDSKVLRVIDFIGEEQDIRNIGQELQNIMNENDYEYIDFYQYGIPEDILNEAGFIKRDKNDTNIIPNYFEPFEKKNVDILIATNVKDNKYFMFKGDGDQDRPNLLPGDVTTMNPQVTIVMYHYVRDFQNTKYPDIKGMDVRDFEKQVQFLKKTTIHLYGSA